MRTVMLTGDQRLTAEAVGRELGLLSDGTQILDGRDLDAMSQSEVEARVREVGAFSRISPEHKLAIVTALQAGGDIVAMLGDGVNDAAALKKADVGVAMGRRGTDVAKEAASIVLQDDRFETIAAAVEEGRVIFDNIRKFVFYLFSCNVAEILVVLASRASRPLPMPLLPLQLLWLNMVTDTFPALALAMEPGDADVMARPPRDPEAAILSPPFPRQHPLLWRPHHRLDACGILLVARSRPGTRAVCRVHDVGVCADVSSRQCEERRGRPEPPADGRQRVRARGSGAVHQPAIGGDVRRTVGRPSPGCSAPARRMGCRPRIIGDPGDSRSGSEGGAQTLIGPVKTFGSIHIARPGLPEKIAAPRCALFHLLVTAARRS